MRWLGGLLDRLVLLAGVIAGGCVPSFVLQYRQRLGGRLDQVLKDLAPFQEVANRLHGGSLDALVQHHLASSDATFHAEGEAIRRMMDAARDLRAAAQALNADLWHQMAYLLTRADADLARATWGSFHPAFVLTGESMLLAAAVGLTIWLLFVALWTGAVLSMRKLRHAF